MSWLEQLLSSWRAKREPDATTKRQIDLDDVIARMQAASLPCVRFAHGASTSKLGGMPDLPDGVSWPSWKSKPLAFLAQIDLEAARKVGGPDWLPNTGMLFFFYDAEQSTWGFDPADRGSWAVIHGSKGSRTTNAPPSFEPFPETPISMRTGQSLPSPERLGFELASLSQEQWEAVDDLLLPNEPAHQLGGFPLAVQNEEMEEECQMASNGIYVGDPEGYAKPEVRALQDGVGDWRLLMQIDSDDDAEMMWGDVGRLYFWIRRQDVEAQDFSNVWMVLQCS